MQSIQMILWHVPFFELKTGVFHKGSAIFLPLPSTEGGDIPKWLHLKSVSREKTKTFGKQLRPRSAASFFSFFFFFLHN